MFRMVPTQPIATIHRFGPFRLDAEAEILFRGVESTVLGQRAVALFWRAPAAIMRINMVVPLEFMEEA